MKKIGVFYKSLIIFLTVLSIGIAISLIYLWNWLGNYQASLPVHEMDNIVAVIKSSDFNKLADNYNFAITDFENRDAVISFLENGFKGNEKITYKKIYSREGTKYSVYADKNAVFSVNLEKKDKGYAVTRSELITKIDVNIDIPKGFTLYINDIEVDTKWIEETIDENSTGFNMLYCMIGKEKAIDSYRISGLLKEVHIKVKDYEGNLVELELDKKLTVSYENLKFVIPDNCKIYINDKQIEDEFVTNRNVDLDIDGYIFFEYSVEGILGDYTYVIKDSDDKKVNSENIEGVIGLKKVDYTVTVPMGYSVYIKGTVLSEKHLKQSDVIVKSLSQIPDKYVKKPLYDMYIIDMLGTIPEVVVKNKDGFQVNTTVSEDKAIASFSVSETVAKDYYDIVKERAFMHSKYVTEDLPWTNFQKVLKSDTEVYKTYSELQPYFYTDHIGYEFKDVEMKNLQKYSDNCISCDISYEHFISKTKTEVYSYPSSFTFYLVKLESEWYIMDFVVH